MNTLSRALTARIFSSETDYQALCGHWRGLVNSPRRFELNSAHHLLYQALLGRDWRKGFTLPTNPLKLANGAFDSWGLFRAWMLLHREAYAVELLEPFGDLVTLPMLRQIQMLLPWKLVWGHGYGAYTPDHFPFEAYSVPADWLQPKVETNDA
jgi:hypothetical protein